MFSLCDSSSSIVQNCKNIQTGSKSIINRVVTLAGMSSQPTLIENFFFSDDTKIGLEGLKKLGFQIQVCFLEHRVFISPPNFQELNQINFYDQIFELNVGKSGTMARFFPAVILNWTKTFPEAKPIQVFFDADVQLKKRPIVPLMTALKKLGAKIEGETYPFQISSSNLRGKTTINTEQSSQFLSGLLIASAGAKNKISIEREGILPQQDYVSITLDTLKKFKAPVQHSPDFINFSVSSTKDLSCSNFFVEPDASTICYFLAYAFLHNFSLHIHGLGKNSLQPDVFFCDYLTKMGAHIELNSDTIKIHKRANTELKGGFSYNFSLMSDQALTAGVLALFANAPIEITGIAHIRYHESNRIACFVQNLQKFGFQIEEKTDGFIVYPNYNHIKNISGVWNTYEDHRFAMSGVLLSSVNSQIIIENQTCVSKTAPNFFENIETLTILNC